MTKKFRTKKPSFIQKSQVSCIAQLTTSSMLGVYNGCPPLATYMWWYLSSSCCSEPQCAHIQLSPFYPWRHAHEKRFQALRILRATENGTGLGTRLALTPFTCMVCTFKACNSGLENHSCLLFKLCFKCFFSAQSGSFFHICPLANFHSLMPCRHSHYQIYTLTSVWDIMWEGWNI